MPAAPPYQRVAEEIRRRIADGVWSPGAQLPSRRRLAAELGVTDVAVRMGMALLRRAGELEGTQRSRLFVAHPPAVRTLIDPDGDWPYLTGDGGGLGACSADSGLADRLDVPQGQRLRWYRMECLDPDSRPSHLVTTWWVGRRVDRWDHCAAVAEFHELTAGEAEHLGLLVGTRAWLVQRTRYVADRPVETADLVLPADRWQIRLA